MSEPVCPSDYKCTFVPDRAPNFDAWWEGPWGIVVAVIAVLALAILLGYLASVWKEHRDDVLGDRRREAEHRRKLELEEQYTVQLDAAQGNPEMLKLVKGSS